MMNTAERRALDALLDEIYERGTLSEAVIPLAEKMLESKRAEIERLKKQIEDRDGALNEAKGDAEDWRDSYDSIVEEFRMRGAEIERLRVALHHISLASQNSMSSKDECGRIARAAFAGKEEN